MRRELGRLHHDGAVDVDDLQALGEDVLDNAGEHLHGVGIAPALIRVREALADVAQPCSAQQRVDHRVREHVGVGVTVQAQLERDLHPADQQLAPRDQPVGVEADPYERHRDPASLEPAWASARSVDCAAPIGSRRR